ncbi:uncharacterized protein EV422DRAFT_593496 [Fimicolochytrium jonesii]|uniref:uncharacterized protein n=1 Tax=Fimicolochytrium jonesii TaxID=1396493 RepID=UPI0022FF3728|nr:uncharacterized protein EV422DRAFT_593496 [Fimicolochytrium jonesii]KAI8826893.1 hypothetical protein EV422DRAFT_593496 [Fimicolochytrium jonesii]
MSDTQLACILKAGPLALKRSPLAPAKKFVVLCAPSTVEDLQLVFTLVFKQNPQKGLEPKSIQWLGNMASAAVKGTPLLIILSSETSTNNPTFIHFANIHAISDESQLRSACNFTLHVDGKPSEYRFGASSSTDYQEWNVAISNAMQILTERTMGGAVADAEDESPFRGNIYEKTRISAGEEQTGFATSPVPSNEFRFSGSQDGWNTPTTISPAESPLQTISRKATGKMAVLPDYIAPQATSRKYTLGSDPSIASEGRDSYSTRSPSVRSPRTSEISRHSDVPPAEEIHAPNL